MALYVAVVLGTPCNFAFVASRIAVPLLAIEQGAPTIMVGVLLAGGWLSKTRWSVP